MTNFLKSLENPVWHSLTETHKKYLIECNGVKFYDPNICPFGAFFDASKTADALNEYAKLTKEFFLVNEDATPTFDATKIHLEQKIECCQMVLEELIPCEITEDIIPLTEVHINDIYDLVWLVMPGYYKKRTFDMGKYFGIFKDDKLVALSGQRMQTDDFIEVSAVVTHPDYTRRGLAKQLVAHTTTSILNDKKHPILHTTKGNPAIKLYEKLGYKITRDMNWWLFSRK